MACHDVTTKVSPFVTNIDHTRLLTFLTKQHHLARAPDLARIGPINLVIYGWSCQGLSQASTGQGHFGPKSCLLWELICVVQHLQQSHMHPCAYLLQNVPPLRDIKPIVLTKWQQIEGLDR